MRDRFSRSGGDSELLALGLGGFSRLDSGLSLTSLAGLGFGFAQLSTPLWLLHNRFSVFGLDGFSVLASARLSFFFSLRLAVLPPLSSVFLGWGQKMLPGLC